MPISKSAHPLDERVYTAIYPYFAEYCAVSEFDKKKGFGVDSTAVVRAGIRCSPERRMPRARCRISGACLVDETPDGMAGRGVGLSVNDHYRNANWTATEGRDLLLSRRARAG